tara:strand:- start:2393 stop:3160 length:768 start_codon:yes stop_codon:yes gene_type:complete
MNLFIYGDSFAHPHNGDFLWYRLLAEYLDVEIKNFAINGEGPIETVEKFRSLSDPLNDSYFVIILSAPERLNYDFLPDGWTAPAFKDNNVSKDVEIIKSVDKLFKSEFEIHNLKNVLFFKFISDFIKHKSKFFVCTTFGFDESFYSEHLKKISNKNFFVSDLNLDEISYSEFIDYENMDCITEYNRFRYENKTTKLLLDERPNHFSKENHFIFSQLIFDFFENGTHTYYRKDLFKKNHLNENSEFITNKSHFIYE